MKFFLSYIILLFFTFSSHANHDSHHKKTSVSQRDFQEKSLSFLKKEGDMAISIYGLVCSFCAEATRKSLSKIPQINVKTIVVDPKEQMVRFSLNKKGKLDLQQLNKVISKSGYRLGFVAIFTKIKIQKNTDVEVLLSSSFTQELYMPYVEKKHKAVLGKEIFSNIFIDLSKMSKNTNRLLVSLES